MNRLNAGATVNVREIATVTGEQVAVPDAKLLTHMQFRRFAGCPVCNLHLRSVANRHAEIEASGVREVVFFHSTAEDLLPHVDVLPFAVVADPKKRFYREFGVEQGRRAVLNPRAWWPIARAVAHSVTGILTRTARPPAANPEGGRYGLPADFLIAPDGRIVACKYGDHVDDQWSVDEVVDLALQYQRRNAEMP
ncbi:peroxiredoxin-like family protein [Mycolicibacterium holsaticum]|uniref:peroxiredoxin-like family protein n=1 Tax=Mycolicibacterium holsaticum TaxID=152142 RepID=UPI002329F1A3|nr:alkyl hydroperoxide reductase [Mycolicibacterium holsaticum DSM 44478 = JCM 12374]